MDFITEQKKTPVAKKVDVIVIGAGPAGFGAAMGATRNGAETLLYEINENIRVISIIILDHNVEKTQGQCA